MKMPFGCALVGALLVFSVSAIRVCPAAEKLPLSELDLSLMTAGWGEPQVDKNCVGKTMSVAGEKFTSGVGTHAHSVLHVELDGRAERFTAKVGVDDIHYDHANWAEAVFQFAGRRPKAIAAPQEAKVILTPPPGPEPRINGPKVFGARPGRPFLYRIPCTGQRPIRFAADNLTEDLRLDPSNGIITGRVPQQRGEYAITLTATNDHGTATRPLKLVVGDQLALTPPMGWNSWYIHYHRVTDKVMRQAADQMIASGMADYGYMYVNIDDCWMRIAPEHHERVKQRFGEFDMQGVVGVTRDEDGNVLPNDNFPDMKAMTDYIHAQGLRAGIYTSPGPRTCQQYEGSYQHERRDAEQYAAWGFDFLKYDWCTYGQVATGEGLDRLQRPYRQMADILKTLDRDVVFNLCQYGMGDVWQWGGEVGGNCWRTTGDLGLARGTQLPGCYHIGLANARHWQHAKPGQWNDPDYILIGWVGQARGHGIGKPTTLTGNEQYSYMSMWCLMAAPLIFSGDMARLDDFTLNVLCNPEVIEVDQDPLGRQARIVRQSDDELVLAKPLEDGSLAVGLFNLGEIERTITVAWEQLKLSGKQRVRDLWRHQDIGVFDGQFETPVGRHGVKLVRLRPDR
jgi:alpha-galactosidase